MVCCETTLCSIAACHGLRCASCQVDVVFLLENLSPFTQRSSACIDDITWAFEWGSFQEPFAGPFPIRCLHVDLGKCAERIQLTYSETYSAATVSTVGM
jgi:hypothetical protein